MRGSFDKACNKLLKGGHIASDKELGGYGRGLIAAWHLLVFESEGAMILLHGCSYWSVIATSHVEYICRV